MPMWYARMAHLKVNADMSMRYAGMAHPTVTGGNQGRMEVAIRESGIRGESTGTVLQCRRMETGLKEVTKKGCAMVLEFSRAKMAASECDFFSSFVSVHVVSVTPRSMRPRI